MAELLAGLRRGASGIRTRVVVGYVLLAAITMVAGLLLIRQVMVVRLEDDVPLPLERMPEHRPEGILVFNEENRE